MLYSDGSLGGNTILYPERLPCASGKAIPAAVRSICTCNTLLDGKDLYKFLHSPSRPAKRAYKIFCMSCYIDMLVATFID